MNYRVIVLGLAIVVVCARHRASGTSYREDEPSLRITDPTERLYRTNIGSSITITCTGVNFDSDYNVYWSLRRRIDTITITSAVDQTPADPAKYQISQSDGEDKFKLNVTAITTHDKGHYTCSTFYSGRQIWASIEVMVEDVPSVQVFAENISAPIAGKVVLPCQASGVPMITAVRWQRNGSVITNGTDGRFFIYTQGRDVIFSKLVINNVSVDDQDVYTCKATNAKGSSVRDVELSTYTANHSDAVENEMVSMKTLNVIDPNPFNAEFEVMGTLKVTCLATGYPYQPKMLWKIQSVVTGPVLHLRDSEERNYDDVTITTYVMQNTTGFYYTLMYYPVMFNNTGNYTCVIPHHTGTDKATVDVTIKGPPMVVATQVSNFGLLDEQIILSCLICAYPKPTLVLWYFEDTLISASSRVKQDLAILNSVQQNATLTINDITDNDFGTYTCKAYNIVKYGMAVQVIQDVDECSFNHNCDHGCINGLGTYMCTCDNGYKLQADGSTCQDVNECQLTEKVACEQMCTNYNGTFECSCHDGWVLDDNGKTCTNTNDDSGESTDDEAIEAEEIYSIIGATSGALLIIILLILCIVWCRRKKDEEEIPMKAVYSVNTGYSSSNIDMSMTKYNSTNTKDTTITHADEFPRQRLQLGIDLGQGRFGKVMMARALNVSGIGKWEMVAVKTCRDSASDVEKEDLYQELEIMRSIDKHPNIVSYLGCCTKQDPLYILMEYVSGGNLQTQLRKCRPSQLATSGEDINTPTVKELETHALHVAKGMVYLSSKGIIHRDLAARNILVGPNRVAKICDFGLARDVEGSDMYERTSKGPSPIRWMAPESLSDQCFTRKSDVWSFGVLLWEIVTLGATPYPGMTAREVIKSVLIGKWLQCPLHCQQELYSLMTRCWDMEPKERPSFSEIAKELETFIESESDYMSLDALEEAKYGVLDPDKVDERV